MEELLAKMYVWFSATPGATLDYSDKTALDHQCCLCSTAEMGVLANIYILENV